MIPPLFLRDGDGHVSPQEFCAALRSAGAAVGSTEALALYRTAAEQGEGLIAVCVFFFLVLVKLASG